MALILLPVKKTALNIVFSHHDLL